MLTQFDEHSLAALSAAISITIYVFLFPLLLKFIAGTVFPFLAKYIPVVINKIINLIASPPVQNIIATLASALGRFFVPVIGTAIFTMSVLIERAVNALKNAYKKNSIAPLQAPAVASKKTEEKKPEKKKRVLVNPIDIKKINEKSALMEGTSEDASLNSPSIHSQNGSDSSRESSPEHSAREIDTPSPRKKERDPSPRRQRPENGKEKKSPRLETNKSAAKKRGAGNRKMPEKRSGASTSDKSLLTTYGNPIPIPADRKMPPRGDAKTLSTGDLVRIALWQDMGAKIKGGQPKKSIAEEIAELNKNNNNTTQTEITLTGTPSNTGLFSLNNSQTTGAQSNTNHSDPTNSWRQIPPNGTELN